MPAVCSSRCATTTICSGSGAENGRKRNAFVTLNIAAVPLIPIDRVSATVAVKPGGVGTNSAGRMSGAGVGEPSPQCGNGIDDNNNGQIDEHCASTSTPMPTGQNVDESSELGASPMPEPPKLRIRDRTTQQVSPMLVSQIGDSGGAG